MNDAQLDIEQHFKDNDLRRVRFPTRNGKLIEATYDPQLRRWNLLRDRVPIVGGPFTPEEALSRLRSLAGQAVGLIRIG
jgi:hypothetical protein